MCIDKKKAEDLMLMLGLNETTDQWVMESSAHWYGDVLRREDGHVLRRALDFEVEGQRKKGRPKRTWKRQVELERVKVGLSVHVADQSGVLAQIRLLLG